MLVANDVHGSILCLCKISQGNLGSQDLSHRLLIFSFILTVVEIFMLPTTRYWILFSSLAGLVLSVSASLYPTNPISRTVWSAGRSENISWIDDGKYPYLNDMGVLNIELYVAGNVGFQILFIRQAVLLTRRILSDAHYDSCLTH